MKKFSTAIQSISWLYSHTTLTDHLIILLAIALLIGLYSRYWLGITNTADYALLFAPNSPPQRIDLRHDQQLHIQGYLGESVIEVKNHQIRFLTSPCQGKHCIHAGWLKTQGDFAACLPNRISIELHHTQTTDFDAISY
jgi:hypothetical protein